MALSSWQRLANSTQIQRHYSEKPVGLAWRSNRGFIVATVAIGLITDLFLYAFFVPVLPFMLENQVGLPQDQVQSQVSNLLAAYAGASVAISPIAAIIADQFSTRQSPFLFGLGSLCGATVLLLKGQSMAVLMAARVLQGTSAALVWTVGLALCLETVGPENLGKTLGSIFSVVSVSNLVAPMLGGIMYDKTGTAGVFGVAFLLLAVDFFMRVLVIEIKVAHRYEPRKLDHCASSATTSREQDDVTAEEQASIEASPLLATRNIGGNPYRLSPDMPAYVHKVPILSCLGDFRLLTALFIGFVQGVLLGSIDGTVPMVAQEYYDFSSLHAGLMFVPIGLANLLLGPLLGWCVDRFGTRIVAVLLYTYLVPVLILFRILHPGGAHQVVVYAVLLALTGIGLAGTGAPSVVEASTIVYKYHEANPDLFGKYGPFAQLYSLTNSCFSLGLAIGPELAGRLRQTIGYGNMNAVLAGICAFTALICLCFIDVKTRVSI